MPLGDGKFDATDVLEFLDKLAERAFTILPVEFIQKVAKAVLNWVLKKNGIEVDVDKI